MRNWNCLKYCWDVSDQLRRRKVGRERDFDVPDVVTDAEEMHEVKDGFDRC